MISIKGVLDGNRVQVNKFQLFIAGVSLPPVFTRISGLEVELDAIDLPDRTTRSGGREKPLEFEVDQPMHHTVELLSMEAWWLMCANTVPGYIRVGALVMYDEYGFARKTGTLTGMWISKRSHSDLDLDNDGDMAIITWTIKADDLVFI
jgi:hypothetical protein